MGGEWPNKPFSSSLTLFVIITLSLPSTTSATATGLFTNVSTSSFDESYSPLFGDGNLVRLPDSSSVRLILDRYTGSGFISSDSFQHGLFSAYIKLPSGYTAGVVVAFYTSNGDVFEKNHDELDFEFLGNIDGKEWRMQTNFYGNGSTSRGREERFRLPFDPTFEAHRYSIVWTPTTIIFYVDETPIREVRRSEAMGGDYPLKPMSLYATIWDGSSWATSGGKYKTNYKFSPFSSDFSNLILRGCRVDPIEQVSSSDKCAGRIAELSSANYAVITPEKRRMMEEYRSKYMFYSACYDTNRYPIPLPECDVNQSVPQKIKPSGHLYRPSHHNRRRRRSKRRNSY